MNPLRLVIAGGTGFLGSLLSHYFATKGSNVTILTRHPPAGSSPSSGIRFVTWDGVNLGAWCKELEGADALLNLSGRSVDCRYHARNRAQIMNSRIHSTQILGIAIGQCSFPPRVWLNASTATIYRHTLGPAWDESGEIAPTPEAHDAFSIDVATAWERVLFATRTPSTRKVALRAAMVLGKGRNSVFPVLARLARLGLGGRMGRGDQYMSWIHEEDFCRAIEWILERESLTGPINLCAPNPLPNVTFMRCMREAVGVPVGIPAPEWLLEIGTFLLRTETELLIKSRRVIPGTLLRDGFGFRFPQLENALNHLVHSAR